MFLLNQLSKCNVPTQSTNDSSNPILKPPSNPPQCIGLKNKLPPPMNTHQLPSNNINIITDKNPKADRGNFLAQIQNFKKDKLNPNTAIKNAKTDQNDLGQ